MKKNSKISPLPPPKTAAELLDMYFLDLRCALLETAAGFDRIERAGGGDEIFNDPRFEQLIKAFDIIKNEKGNRTEKFLTLFSEYSG